MCSSEGTQRSNIFSLPPASPDLLLGTFFHPEDIRDIFLRNAGLSPIYAAHFSANQCQTFEII
jgi:hypothetical protein